ncbi:MAG TPA: enoyl-CoA hydratase [Nocardioidaceae bacterium]|nr:enoyl-CoA hydratase [Nocardioidaceae bacterium]
MTSDHTEVLAEGGLVVRRSRGHVEMVFDRPQRHNALTFAMYDGVVDTCRALAEDREVRTVVFRGAGGRAFAAGNEISQFLTFTAGEDGVAYEARLRRVVRSIAELPQVTIAAVEGICVGAGLAVATHCDLRICTEGSRFGYPIARTLGNALSASVLYRCVAVFGESLTREMLLTSRLVDASRAYAVGAVMSTVAADDFEGEVDDVVSGIEAAARLTATTTKTQLRRLAERTEASTGDDEELLERVYGSADFCEGVRAFLAKERPRFGSSG